MVLFGLLLFDDSHTVLLRAGLRRYVEGTVMGEYEDTVKDIEKSFGFVPGFMKPVPKDVLVKQWPLLKKYQMGESVIPQKYRELIGLAVAATLKCPYCTLMHTAMAKGYGATDEEISEAGYLTAQTANWSSMLYANRYDYDTFAKEVNQIGENAKKKAGKK
jgi:AhpD family alkylhydroperoxidase